MPFAHRLSLDNPHPGIANPGVAAEAVIPGARALSLKDLVGSVRMVEMTYGEVPIVPLPHPSGVGRWLNDPDNRALRRALDRTGA